MLPGHVLSRYHVVLDYAARTFSLGPPGAMRAHGDPLPMPVNRRSGFARTEVRVSGASFGMLVDTGASFTMVSEVVLKRWGAQHPDWPRHPGAFGDAATLGGSTLETMFVPHAVWARGRPRRLGRHVPARGHVRKIHERDDERGRRGIARRQCPEYISGSSSTTPVNGCTSAGLELRTGLSPVRAVRAVRLPLVEFQERLRVRRPDVVGARADQAVVGVLLEDVRGPALKCG